MKELDGRCHPRYIEDYCYWIGITIAEFWTVANSFRGEMWEQDSNSVWRLKNPIWEQVSFDDNIDIYEVIDRIDARRSAQE